MAERVAEIEVYAGLEDRDLIAGLRRAEAEVERTAAKISHERAEAKIGADLSEFRRKIKEAEADLKRFQARQADVSLSAGQRRYAKERAAALAAELAALRKSHTAEEKRLGVLKSENAERRREAQLAEAQAKRDEVHARLLSQQEKRRQQAAQAAQRDIEKQRKAQERADAQAAREAERRARLVERDMIARQRAIDRQVREETRMAAASEREAIRRQKAQEREHYEATVGLAKQRQQVLRLQREFAKLTDRAERAAKRRAFTIEGRAKLELDRSNIDAEMKAIKAQLNYLGEHPPVGIEVEMERRRSMGRIRRQAAEFGDVFRTIAEKAANLSDVAIRIGPFTGTIKQFGIALGFLGPIIIDLLGAAGSLVGVVGAGLAGAATVGTAAVTGLGLAFGGLALSTHTARDEFKLASQATEAYQKAVAKYGESSKEAKNAQEQMNRVLKSVGPLARAAAQGSSEFRAGWERATGPTRKALANITTGFFDALQSITPMWARSTNDLSKTLDKNLRGGFKFLKSREFRGNFKAITDNFNDSVPSLLHALGSFGRAFLNFASEGSKYLEPLGEAVDRLAGRLLKFTQRDDFGDTIKRWVHYAADLGRFLGALSRVVVHFFGAGAEAGDNFVVSMTNALNRWDRFLTSTRGRNEIASGFERAVAGTKALWNALAPVVGAFVTWASNFSPFIAGVLRGVAAVTQLLNGVSELIGLGGPLAALGATIGAIWAIGKIGAFVAMLARIPAILAEIRAASGTLAAVGAVFNGRLIGGMRGAGAAGGAAAEMRTGITSGGAAAAAEMRAGVGAGGAIAAAEIRGAVIAGGAASAAAGAAAARGPGALVGAAGAAAAGRTGAAASQAAGNLSKMARAGNLAKGALGGLGAVAVGVPSVVAGVATAAVAAAGGMYLWQTRTRQWQKDTRDAAGQLANFRNLSAAVQQGNTDLAGSTIQFAQGQLRLKDALRQSSAEERQLAQMRRAGKKGTDEYTQAEQQHKQTLLDVKDARLQDIVAERSRKQLYEDQKKRIEDTTAASDKAVKKAREAVREQAKGDGLFDKLLRVGSGAVGLIAHLRNRGKLTREAEQAVKNLAAAEKVAAQRSALAAVNMANLERGMKGLAPMARSAGKALDTVNKLGGKNLTSKISLKFQDPGQAQRVAASAAKSLKAGVPKTVTSRIVADSRNAEQAVKRLQAARITPKKLQIIQQGGPQAIKMLEQIMARKLTRQELKIAQRGGEDVLDKLRAISARDLPPKTQRLKATGREKISADISAIVARASGIHDKSFNIKANDHASGIVSNVIAQINSIPATKTVTIIGKKIGAALDKAKASGGVVGTGAASGASQPNERQIARAAATAELAGARQSRGGKYNQPTLLVGEENRSEVVITGNPKYRSRNVEYLRMAARMLGKNVTDGVESAAAGTSPFGTFKSGVFNPKAVLKPKQVFKPSKKKSAKIKSNRSWAQYIEGLETQQGYWEREVSIRESQIREPEDMVVRAPENDTKVLDPTTGETTTVEAFKPNPEIESSYKPSLQAVLDAMRTLMSIVAELVRAIPHALKANVQERKARETTVGNLSAEIRKENNRLKGSKGDARDKHEKRIDKLKDRRDKEKEEIATLKDDEKSLNEKHVEAGFDAREVAIAYGTRLNEYNSASGKAQATADEQNAAQQAGGAGAAGGAGGAAASTAIGIQEQTALALQQNAQTLSSFGQNFIGGAASVAAQFAAGAVAGAGTGIGAGTVLNPAAIGADGAASALGSGAGARQALTSGAAAATLMTQTGSGGTGTMDTGAAPAPSVTNTTVNNTFLQPPPDPHTWSKGVEFELGATI